MTQPTTSPIQRVASLPGSIETRFRGSIISAMRILLGGLWLSNIEWKRPWDFGKDLKNGLYKYVDSGVNRPVLRPYAWILKHIVLKQYTLFGWMTVLLECSLAALLLLGLWTRGAALVGAGQAVMVALAVIHYPNEWPWSYYLMAGMHLLLFAVASEQTFSLDRVRKTGGAAKNRAATLLGAIAVIVGLWGLFGARHTAFAAHQGARLGWPDGELKILWFNKLSALLTIGVGLVVIAAIRLRQPLMAWIAVAVSALMAIQVIAQWRYNRGQWTGGFLGGTGPNIALWGMLALGVAMCLPSPARATAAG